MVDLDLTNAINNLCNGKATKTEQEICGLVLKNMIQKPKVVPNYNSQGLPYCPNCNQPLNTKLKNGLHVHQFCKCCGQHINWNDEKENANV